MSDTGERCVLAHRGFMLLGDLLFQRSETDGLPVAIIPLGGRRAALPLRALQREMAIDDDSEDGRMLALIAEALDYVISLRQGDLLPAEVLTGEASWAPLPRHLAAARKRLRASVLRWTAPADRPADLEAALAALAPLTGAADSRAAAAALDALAHELAFIEASREVLLQPVRRLGSRLERLRLDSAPGTLRDELTQSRRLAASALARIGARFADVEGCTADIVSALRRPEELATYIRSNRDWLHRGRLAWEPVLKGWETERRLKPGPRRALLSSTYRFLAQRFMSVQEWRSSQTRRPAQHLAGAFEW